MPTRPCGSRNLYCFLHRLSAVPPFYTDSPRSVHPKQWGLLQNTRKASPDNHRNSFSSWCDSSHKCGRHHHPYTATRILFLLFSCIRRIPAEKKHTLRKPHRREKAQQSHLSRTTTCTSSGRDSRCLQSIPRHDKDTTGSGQECNRATGTPRHKVLRRSCPRNEAIVVYPISIKSCSVQALYWESFSVHSLRLLY